MKTLIVYDSFFGNTEKVAKAINDSLSRTGETLMVQAHDFKPKYLNGLDLLITCSPTRAFSPSPSVKTFLRQLPSKSLTGIRVMAFDTRMCVAEIKSKFLHFCVRLFGYAAKPILNGMVKKGGVSIAEPEGFFVEASEGPLRDGEIERAVEWVGRAVKGEG
jgi:flavodoxin